MKQHHWNARGAKKSSWQIVKTRALLQPEDRSLRKIQVIFNMTICIVLPPTACSWGRSAGMDHVSCSFSCCCWRWAFCYWWLQRWIRRPATRARKGLSSPWSSAPGKGIRWTLRRPERCWRPRRRASSTTPRTGCRLSSPCGRTSWSRPSCRPPAEGTTARPGRATGWWSSRAGGRRRGPGGTPSRSSRPFLRGLGQGLPRGSGRPAWRATALTRRSASGSLCAGSCPRYGTRCK